MFLCTTGQNLLPANIRISVMNNSLISLQPLLHRLVTEGHIKIILASASPRRSEALAVMFGGKQYFEVMESEFDEKLPHSDYNSALAYCLETAKMKAQDVCDKLSDTRVCWLNIYKAIS